MPYREPNPGNRTARSRWHPPRWIGVLVCAVSCGLIGCVAVGDERWRLYNEDGVEQFSKGNYGQALDSFDLAMALRPRDPVLIYNTAQCYDRMGDAKKAEQFYTYCLQVDPKHGDSLLALTALQYRTGRTAETTKKIENWLAKNPDSADAYVADAWRLRQEKNLPAAHGRLHQALSIEPHNRRALTEMAILYELMNMPDRSYVLYEDILERDPKQAEIAQRLEVLKVKGVKRPLPN